MPAADLAITAAVVAGPTAAAGTTNLTISLYDTPPVGTNVLTLRAPDHGHQPYAKFRQNVNVPVTVSSPEVTRLQTD